MIGLKCLNCGLMMPYEGSEADFCPRCIVRDQQAVQLIPVSDRPSSVSASSIGRLSIQTSARDDRHIVVLNGELDIASAPILEATLAELCKAGAKEVVLEMSCVEFIDSSGLTAIMRGKKLCEKQQCDYSLTPARRPAQGVFELTGVIDTLPFRDARPRKPERTARA